MNKNTSKVGVSARAAGTVLGAALSLLSVKAYAVPSFARQTGLACAVCHDVPPQLTAFGRQFKLDGYVMTTLKQISAGKNGKDLSIDRAAPLSFMMQISATTFTHEPASKTQAGTTAQNTNIELPQQLSLFYAGEISPHAGTFMQVTYDHASDHFSFDNTDIRYARQTVLGGQSVDWGLDLNNNPTVEDLWNTTPAWGFPWGHSNLAAHPAGSTGVMVNEALGQAVAGVGEYSMWNNSWYEDFSIYRSSPGGQSQVNPVMGSINGIAPYWRLAWQHGFGNNYLEVGTFGMQARFLGGMSGAGATGLADTYTDSAIDSQFDHHFGADLLTLYGSYVHEQQNLASSYAVGGADRTHQNLNNLRLTGTYQFGLHYQTGVSYFNTTGTTDAAYYGTTNGNPDSNGWIARFTYLPWENTQLALQYTAYTKFDGTTAGASRSNSLYLLAWYLW